MNGLRSCHFCKAPLPPGGVAFASSGRAWCGACRPNQASGSKSGLVRVGILTHARAFQLQEYLARRDVHLPLVVCVSAIVAQEQLPEFVRARQALEQLKN